ncbi:MAG: M1 family metallopeptidase [Chitinophagales bacterium]|nr:M1 family metallopeptidase [Chitinophagales bacterium]MDW8273148.1 M1 family metallopeptidase [Chitinophagales bacterium]
MYFLKIILAFQVANLFCVAGFAQLLSKKNNFTRCDTLRGSLRPERTCFDVTYYSLEVVLDTAKKYISGWNDIHYRIEEDFDVFQIDLFSNMIIDRIEYEGQILDYQRECDAVFVYFNKVRRQQKGNHGHIRVVYRGAPMIARQPPWDGGFTWAYDKQDKPFVATSVQGIGASLWYPCKDYLGDEPDSMRIAITCPLNLAAVSNGTLEKIDTLQGYSHRWQWKVTYPINSYNVTLNVADYDTIKDEFIYSDGEKLSLIYYILRYNKQKAKTHFEQVKPMLACYEKYLGKYPFMRDGYKLVETPFLGMEHQSAIAYGNGYKGGYSGIDFSRIGLMFDYIIIHESGHEWWGNSVSCSDLADMWIHESFCTYTEAIYVECMHNYETALRYINAKKNSVGNKSPIIGVYGVNQEGDHDMYSKGSLILNTFRHVLGNDELWWRLIKNISDTTFKLKNTNANELLSHINNYTGFDFTAMFNQYFRHAGIPVFEYSLKRIKGNKYELSYRWKADVKNFSMPCFIKVGKKDPIRLPCTTVLQKMQLKMKLNEKFVVMEDWIYVGVKKFSEI